MPESHDPLTNEDAVRVLMIILADLRSSQDPVVGKYPYNVPAYQALVTECYVAVQRVFKRYYKQAYQAGGADPEKGSEAKS